MYSNFITDENLPYGKAINQSMQYVAINSLAIVLICIALNWIGYDRIGQSALIFAFVFNFLFSYNSLNYPLRTRILLSLPSQLVSVVMFVLLSSKLYGTMIGSITAIDFLIGSGIAIAIAWVVAALPITFRTDFEKVKKQD